MDSLEVRKTRLDFAWKALKVCITVLGAIIVYFGQNLISVPTAGEVVFIGVEALCALLFFVCAKYFYKGTKALRDDNNTQYNKEKENINMAYDDIFHALKIGAICLLIHSILVALYHVYEIEWMSCFIPTQQHIFIIATISFVLLLTPPNKVWIFSSKNICDTDETLCAANNINQERSIQIHTNKVKSLRWTFYSVFWFDLFYLISFAAGGM